MSNRDTAERIVKKTGFDLSWIEKEDYEILVKKITAALGEKDQEIEKLKKSIHDTWLWAEPKKNDAHHINSVVKARERLLQAYFNELDSLLRQVVDTLKYTRERLKRFGKATPEIDDILSLPSLAPYREKEKA